MLNIRRDHLEVQLCGELYLLFSFFVKLRDVELLDPKFPYRNNSNLLVVEKKRAEEPQSINMLSILLVDFEDKVYRSVITTKDFISTNVLQECNILG